MIPNMDATQLIAVAASFSLLAGWRIYATVLVAGLAMRFDLLPLPEHLASLKVLGSWWVIGAAVAGAVAEFLADKVAWVDSAWDSVHSFIRPLGGALIALAIVDPGQPVWQIVTLLLGGGFSLASHGAKASARAAVNLSPEPVSNVVLSGAEDVGTTAGLLIALSHPLIALALVLLMLAATLAVFLMFRRFVRDIRDIVRPEPPESGG